MSFNGFATRLVILPKSSKSFTVVLTVQHLLALGVLPWLSISWLIIILLTGFICLSLYRTSRRHVLHQGRKAITQLTWESDSVIRAKDGEGCESEAILSQNLFVNPRLIILNIM